jgi:hypothetical protein
MVQGTQRLYQVSLPHKVATKEESYYTKPIMAIATTGRAVTYKNKWEGGVYVGLSLPGGKVFSSYFPHTFMNSRGEWDYARTKDEGMLLATYKALNYALEILEKEGR